MKILAEFREFIARGSVVDMVVGIAVGTAFAAIARSLVEDVIMPVVGLALGGAEFENLFVVLRSGDPAPPYATVVDAQAAGAVTIKTAPRRSRRVEVSGCPRSPGPTPRAPPSPSPRRP